MEQNVINFKFGGYLKENTVVNIDFLNNDLPAKCANLIISDPPYYKVKGKFDFIWKSREDYLKDVEKWAIECKRLLADNGTLFWYGSSKNIAYSQIILDEHFNLVNNLVWNKGSFMGLEKSTILRSFAPCTERILMYSNDIGRISCPLYKVQDYLKKLIYDNGGNVTNSNEYYKKYSGLKGNYRSIFFGKSQYNFYTKNQYLGLCEYIKSLGYNDDFIEYEELRKEYEELRKEYEELRRPFNNKFNLQEVLNFSNEAIKTGAKYDHDTVKPELLTTRLIQTCSRKGDTLVVPFAGSGTECAMGVREGLKVYGYEITEKHTKMSNERIKKELSCPRLF